jgi:hypothetical protein
MLLEAATVAVCAKVTEGTTYTDPFFAHYRAEAKRVGAVFFGYHFLHAGGAAAQARHCFSVVGPGVNVMIDHESTTGSNPTVQDAVDFATEFRALGGLCTLDYLPHWYWTQIGSPSLAPFAAAGLSLVSSDYTGYSDTGPGWASYGGVAPVIWQWTDALAYSNQAVDFNAFRGTVDQLRALLGYTAPPVAPVPLESDMPHLISVTPDPTNPTSGNAGIFFVDGGRVSHVATEGYAELLEAKYGAPLTAAPADYAELLASMATTSVSVDAAALGAAIAAGIKLPSTLTLSGTGKLS